MCREDITVEDHDRCVVTSIEEFCSVANSTAGTERFLLDRVPDLQIETGTISEIWFEDLSEITCRKHDPLDTGASRLQDLMEGEWHATDRKHRFRCEIGQWSKSRSPPTDEKDRGRA
jgi:hypothetical protein